MYINPNPQGAQLKKFCLRLASSYFYILFVFYASVHDKIQQNRWRWCENIIDIVTLNIYFFFFGNPPDVVMQILTIFHSFMWKIRGNLLTIFLPNWGNNKFFGRIFTYGSQPKSGNDSLYLHFAQRFLGCALFE